jgi:hypothetical protein
MVRALVQSRRIRLLLLLANEEAKLVSLVSRLRAPIFSRRRRLIAQVERARIDARRIRRAKRRLAVDASLTVPLAYLKSQRIVPVRAGPVPNQRLWIRKGEIFHSTLAAGERAEAARRVSSLERSVHDLAHGQNQIQNAV